MAFELSPYEFREDIDLAKHEPWFLGAVHFVPPQDPFSAVINAIQIQHGMIYGAEMVSLPGCKGWLCGG